MKFTTLLLTGTMAMGATELYVSPSGNDEANGTQAAPLATVTEAQKRMRAAGAADGGTVYLEDGVYYLSDTLVFEPQDSGSEGKPVVYKALNEGGAVLSGGILLELEWALQDGGVYVAGTPKGLDIDQLFINGEQQRMARFPNYDASLKDSPYQGYSQEAFSQERAANWADPAGAYIHAMHVGGWGGYHYVITGKDAEGEVTYEGGWQNNRKMGMHREHRMVENVYEELDAPGEWFHDAEQQQLSFIPAEGTDLSSAKVEVVRLRHLVEFNGTAEAPVENIQLDGLVVRHAARTFMDTKEQLLRSDWAIYRGGAFMLTGTEDVHITNCEFDQVGGNAIFVNNYNRGTLVQGCHIHHTGASGVCFVGDPGAVYNPLFEYGQRNDLSKIDLTPGPKTDNYPLGGVVEDCLIHNIGTVERQPAGVQIEMAAKIRVSDVSVYDCARAGINIGDGAWGGHIIERCDVFDTVMETHDHGSFNSWGRDRYWRADHHKSSQKAVEANPDLPFLDAMYTTTIRDSRWRCEHGWDIDLDDGSTNYDIYNNVLLCGGLKLREGYRRRAWNNILVGSGLSAHVWFSKSGDQVFGNVMARASHPYVVENADVSGCTDKNFYFQSNEATLKDLHEKFQWDTNSVLGEDPFVDAKSGDYTIKAGSKAFEIGFKNFPMDQFGVKKATLKAIAKTPKFGPKTHKPGAAPKKRTKTPFLWHNAKIKGLAGNEFSAYGVTKEDGGVVLSGIKPDSVLAQAGLKNNDLIQELNGIKTKDAEQLIAAVAKSEGTSYTVTVVRNQQKETVTVTSDVCAVYEVANKPEGFQKVTLGHEKQGKIKTNEITANETLKVMSDGKLDSNFGSIFPNKVNNGMYKLDLGAAQEVKAFNSWSYKQGNRGVQKLSVYASNAESDPGWDLTNYDEIGVLDSTEHSGTYVGASLQTKSGDVFGKYRWVVWRVYPNGNNNTAYQEFAVSLEH